MDTSSYSFYWNNSYYIVSASLTCFYTKRNQLRVDGYRLKEKCYLDYIKALSNNVISNNRDESRSKLSDAHNHILLIGVVPMLLQN